MSKEAEDVAKLSRCLRDAELDEHIDLIAAAADVPFEVVCEALRQGCDASRRHLAWSEKGVLIRDMNLPGR